MIRTPLVTLPLLALGGLACSDDPCPQGSFRAANGLCTLVDAPPDSGTASADGADGTGGGTDGTEVDGITLGDPILTLGRQGTEAPEPGPDGMVEWVDATMLTDRYGLTVGVGGWSVVDLETSERIFRENVPRAYRVDSDGAVVAATTRQGQVLLGDVSDPTTPVKLPDRFMGGDAITEDVAVDDGRVLVGWTTEGGVLYDVADNTGEPLGIIPVEHAFAVGLSGDRAVVTSETELSLWDVSAPASPVQLDAVTLQAEGRDADFDGVRVAVATGGAGVEVFSVVDDTLEAFGSAVIPGSAMGVSLDDDALWVSAWETVGLVDLSGDEPVVLGHEDVSQSALGIGAKGGRAIVADWFFATLLERQEGLGGPEVVVASSAWLEGEGEPTAVPVRNGGAFPLTVSVTAAGDLTVDPTEFTVEPGYLTNLIVTPDAGLSGGRSTLTLTTNDPDEQTVDVEVRLPDADIGTTHGPMTLQGLQLPSATVQTYTLEDLRGKVVLLVYWALF